MGTKKTMLIICCALMMVMVMSSCAFAGHGPQGGSSTDIDTSLCFIGVDYTDIDATTTLNNNNNSGVILQGSNGNDFVAIDDITLDLCVLAAYNGNDGSFNENYTNVGNTTYTNVGNTFTATTTIKNTWDSNNTYTVDLKNVGNSDYDASFSYADNSTEVDVIGSFNGANFVNYNDSDCIDYDDNDLIDADVWALVDWN